MAKPVTGLNQFENNATNSLVLLDQNFTTLAQAINDPASYSNYGIDTGAVNAMIITIPNLNMSAYTEGQVFSVRVANTNTGVATLNVNAIGAKSIYHQDGTSLVSGDLVLNNVYMFQYNSLLNSGAGGFNMIGLAPTAAGTAPSVAITATSTNATFYPVIVASASGNLAEYTAGGLTYNPSTGVLAATGGFNGTATGLSGASPALGTNWNIDTNGQLSNTTNTLMSVCVRNSASIGSGTAVTFDTIAAQNGSNFSLSGGNIVFANTGIYEINLMLTIRTTAVGSYNVYFGGTIGSIIGPTSTYPFFTYTGATFSAPLCAVLRVTSASQYLTITSSGTFNGSTYLIDAGSAMATVRRIG